MKNLICLALALLVAQASAKMAMDHKHASKYNVKLPCDVAESQCVKANNNATSMTYTWMALGGNVSFDGEYTEEKTELGECKSGSIIDRVQTALKNAIGKLGRRKRQQVSMGTVSVNAEHVAHLTDDRACCTMLPYAAVQYSQCNVTNVDMNCCDDLQAVVDAAGRSAGARVISSLFSVLAMSALVHFVL